MTELPTSLDIATQKPIKSKPVFKSRWEKKNALRIVMSQKGDIAQFADKDCEYCHGSGVARQYKMGKQLVRNVCQCIQKILNYAG